MADQIPWLEGRAKVPESVEKICPKRHIRQNQWQSEWNKMYNKSPTYDYISDYECIFDHPIDKDKISSYKGRWDDLQAAKQQGTNIPITSLAHFTKKETADKIVASGGFRAGTKKINEDAEGQNVEAKFSWWSPKFDEDDIKLVRETLGQAIEPFVAGEDELKQLKEQFGISDAFRSDPVRYGDSYFQYDINVLCRYYRNLFKSEVQFKILGTFGYKKEVMHAVLVCSQENGAGLFGAYPPVLTPKDDVNNEAVVTRDDDGNWVWKPQATGTRITRLEKHCQRFPSYRRWEHVAFAFHIPDELAENKQLMFVPELDDNLHQI